MNATDFLVLSNIVVLVVLIARTFTTSYFSEKGKGLATKQDIGEITKKIEEVRVEYNSRLESSKAAIQFSLFSNQHFLQKSTEILLRFYDTLILINHDNLLKNLGDFSPERVVEELKAYRIDTLNKFNSLTVDYHRLLVFMNGNHKILRECKDLLELSMRMKDVFNKHFSKVRVALIYEVQASQSTKEKYADMCRKRDEAVLEYQLALNPLRKVFDDKNEVFIKSLMNYFDQKNFTNN